MLFLYILLQFSLADSLFTHGTFSVARIEYLREFFFYPEIYENEHKRLSFAIATVHHDTLAGVRELDKLVDLHGMTIKTKLRIAQQFIALGYTGRVRTVLQGMDSIRIYGYTYLYEGDLATAHAHFLKVGDTMIAYDIKQYLDLPKKSFNTATILSLVCPGAGEIYGGNITQGIKDLALNAGSIFLLYNALRQKKYIDAVLVFNLLFHRFYVGSLYNAQKCVLETNKNAYDEWHDYMQRTYFQDLDDH